MKLCRLLCLSAGSCDFLEGLFCIVRQLPRVLGVADGHDWAAAVLGFGSLVGFVLRHGRRTPMQMPTDADTRGPQTNAQAERSGNAYDNDNGAKTADHITVPTVRRKVNGIQQAGGLQPVPFGMQPGVQPVQPVPRPGALNQPGYGVSAPSGTPPP